MIILNEIASWCLEPEKLEEASDKLGKDVCINCCTLPETTNKDHINVYADFMEHSGYLAPVQEVIEKHSDFDLILTRRKEILEQTPNSKLFMFGSCWITSPELVWNNKKNSISYTTTSKRSYGWDNSYDLRLTIAENFSRLRQRANLPMTFYNSSRCPVLSPPEGSLVLGESKSPIFESMFSIVCENEQSDYFFTEKLIDCLITKTVPIYHGSLDVPEIFNPDGMFFFNNMEELVSILDTITEKDYNSRLSVVEENYNTALVYAENLTNRVSKEIVKCLS
jgi:hypothetical protein